MEDSTKPLSKVIRIDESEIRGHLDEMVRGTVEETLNALLDAEANSKMQLTSGYAMLPASSVSGYYFAHPESSYFVLGNILEDQLLDYAKRKNISPERARNLLTANIYLQPVK